MHDALEDASQNSTQHAPQHVQPSVKYATSLQTIGVYMVGYG